MSIKIDDSELAKPFISPLCLVCDHVDDFDKPKTCKAFPEGIPSEILSGDFVHTKKYKKETVLFAPVNVET